MKALTGISVALLNDRDMDYLEKDEMGNFPKTVIDGIKILEKERVLIKICKKERKPL